MTRPPPPARIVPAALGHVARIARIEREAARRFDPADVPPAVVGEATPRAELERAAREGRLWVALGGHGDPVGFALAQRDPQAVYLAELDVLPAHGRRGVGRALIAAVCAWAREQGVRAVTLTTFSHVPWNAPFYRKLGFRELGPGELPPELAARLAEQAEQGLDPARRVAMICPLDGAAPDDGS